MPGIVYNMVKIYEDRFIYSVIKYKSANYLETATSNVVKIVVDDIKHLDCFASEHGLQTNITDAESDELIHRMIRVFNSKAQLGIIDDQVFRNALEKLKPGDGFQDLKRYYSSGYKEKKRKEREELLEVRRQKRLEEENERQEKELEKQQEKREAELREKQRWREQDLIRAEKKKEREEKRYQAWLEQQRIKWEKKRQAEEQRKKEELEKSHLYEYFCAYINKPVIRTISQTDKKVFDVIEVDVGLTQIIEEQDIIPLLNQYKERMIKDVLKAIENYPRFIKYGVPIDYIDIASITFNKKSRVVHLMFVLKEIHKMD